ncbi:MAG: 30S ribosomal protein S20, partial [Candidatus Promineifilaceae bacterium]
RVFRSSARTYIKNTRVAIAQGDLEEAENWASMAAKTLDKAASKGILHKRNVARRKSRIMKALSAAKQKAA